MVTEIMCFCKDDNDGISYDIKPEIKEENGKQIVYLVCMKCGHEKKLGEIGKRIKGLDY